MPLASVRLSYRLVPVEKVRAWVTPLAICRKLDCERQVKAVDAIAGLYRGRKRARVMSTPGEGVRQGTRGDQRRRGHTLTLSIGLTRPQQNLLCNDPGNKTEARHSRWQQRQHADRPG